MSKIGLSIAAAVSALALTSGTAAFAEGKGLVAFSQADMANEWRVMNTKEMEQAFKEAGYDFVWANANADPAKQLADIEDLLSRKPDLLVVAPIEFEPLAPVPRLAEEADTDLIVVDRALPGEPGTGKWISLVTIDFVDTGVRVAEDAVEQLTEKYGEPKGKLLHVTGNTGASPVIDEQTGLDQVFDQYENIEIVGTCDGRYARETGRSCTEDLLQAFSKGDVDGIIFDNDDMMMGGLSAISSQGRDELRGWLWGKDGTVEGLQAVLDGDMTFTVQTPPFFGGKALEVWEAAKAGNDVAPVQYVDKESFDNDTDAQMKRVEERIEELKALGVGCC
ncbi:ribose transport system substrate-binding protein [Aliiruegeria haliotis]|uniref:Ribose transport system substrate-binding protein n=1 Tax=Aliiruegeria haliotis TaxID=1280846 RepID=A0A2T0RET6_9RHOB|nr:substrate-binding domain-containing protein [Aliiruegeria haliotis]PRY19673.1 ribose transport system substrate-binding protein [Aliiruegeria haliotis]